MLPTLLPQVQILRVKGLHGPLLGTPDWGYCWANISAPSVHVVWNFQLTMHGICNFCNFDPILRPLYLCVSSLFLSHCLIRHQVAFEVSLVYASPLIWQSPWLFLVDVSPRSLSGLLSCLFHFFIWCQLFFDFCFPSFSVILFVNLFLSRCFGLQINIVCQDQHLRLPCLFSQMLGLAVVLFFL